MEVLDGFIVGIFNYCDRWCETCEFTSWCRVFADGAQTDAAFDPSMKELVEAPPLPEEEHPDAIALLAQEIEEMNERSDSDNDVDETSDDAELDAVAPAHTGPRLLPEDEPVQACAHKYVARLHAWLETHDWHSIADPSDPRAVVDHFQYLIPAKIFRALTGRAFAVAEGDVFATDQDGSAKVALLGIERSHAALLDIVERGLATQHEVDTLIADLVRLCDDLDARFPKARAFVRPGFDEPEAFARLKAQQEWK